MENDRSDEVKLEPCAKCGQRDWHIAVNDGWFWSECWNCSHRTGPTRSRAEALSAWNRRVPPRAENAQVAEPVGWVLVPREPTEAMLSAGALVSSEAASGGFASSPYEMYRDMLLASPLAPQAAQCCMCGKTGLSTTEGDGGAECQLSDGRWTCSQNCWERAVDPPAPQAEVTEDFVETVIDAIMGLDRFAPKSVPMGMNPPLFDGMHRDSDGPWLSRVEVAKALRAALSIGESGR